jgi:hypothetical protein
MKGFRKVATPSEDEFLADDRVIDAYVRAWLGPVALLTVGLRVVVASVQEDERLSSTARAVRTTRAPQRASISKQPAGQLGRDKYHTHRAAIPRRNKSAVGSAIARLTARARWFS